MLLTKYRIHPCPSYQPPSLFIRDIAAPQQLRLKMSASIVASAGTEAVGGEGAPISQCAGKNDLLIVGPGVLGRLVAESWMKENPSCRVVGKTKSTDHHEELQNLGIEPCLKGSQTSEQFPYVIFCAPPSGSGDYPDDVRAAAIQWSGEGSFLFTSSSAVYACNDNGLCFEDQKKSPYLHIGYFISVSVSETYRQDSPTVPIGSSSRTDVLLKAESEVLKTGGSVVRLAGLYKFDRGAHLYCLEKGTIDTRPDHIINLIHYEDAASLCISILKSKFQRRVFMGCDNHPLSRQDLMEYVNRSGKFEGKFHGFTGVDGPLGKQMHNTKTRIKTGVDGPLGKQMHNTKTRIKTGWEPKYPSFVQFLGLSE